jgi:hypothetical protein
MRNAFRIVPVLLAACAFGAAAQSLPDNTRVRVIASGVGNGQWLDGRIGMNRSSGCTMVTFDRKQAGGITMVAVNSVAKLERQEKGGWVEVPVKPLLAKETKECREAANG